MVPLSEIFAAFARVGVLSFGGPAAQIGLMHRTLVDEKRWLSEDEYLRALSFCMLLPGPEAMQLATYAGWKLRGIPGGLIAGGLFVLPGALVIAVLATLYARFGQQPDTTALLLGIKAAVIAIVVQALMRLAGKALTGPEAYALAGLSFLAIFAFAAPFPAIVAAAAAWGAWRADPTPPATVPETGRTTPPRVLALWAGLWLAPLPVLWALDQTLLFDLAVFFAKLAVVTFGGAYAVLAYMAQEVVQVHGWLETTEMVDALGLAETTPGPLILVTQFVGHLAGFSASGLGLGLMAGALTLWMTFVPCFLWIFAGAPHVERLLARPRLSAALRAITAAVVGVILNLSVWFAAHVFFARTAAVDAGPLSLTLPVPGTLVWQAVALLAVAAGMLFAARRSVLETIALCALCGWALGQLAG